MKKIITLLAVLAVSLNTYSQEFQGEAIYKSHRKMDFKMDGVDEGSAMEKQIQAQLAKQFQKEYTLSFTREESLYKVNESLAAPTPGNSMMTFEISGAEDVMYKNIKENRYVSEKGVFGKQFLIKDTLKPIAWELVNETKSIGVYPCRKAIFKETYTEETLNQLGKYVTETKERITTAWYSLDIPVNNGPSSFNGLPGLILEINDGELTLVCTRVTLNPKNKITIKEPKKGKAVDQDTFNAILAKKSKEMKEKFQSGRGNVEVREIRIGG